MFAPKKSKLLTTNYSLLIFGGILFSLIFFISLLTFNFVLLTNTALAIDVPAPSGLSTRPLADSVASIINAFVGLTGTIALVIIVYGGYLWMFSGGDPKKIDKAKKVLISATIGLLIILLSWAIVSFIFNAVGGNNNGNNPIIVNPPLPPTVYSFRVEDYSPKGNVPVAVCMPVQARFSLPLDQNTLPPILPTTFHLRLNCTTGFPDGNTFCAAANLGTCSVAINAQQYCSTEVPGAMAFASLTAPNFTFRPTNDLEKNAAYLVTINDGSTGVKSQSGRECVGLPSDLGECKQWEFTTNDQTDKIPPQVAKVSPTDTATNVCRLKSIAAQFNEEMDETTLRTAGAFSITPADTVFNPSVPSYTVLRENPSSPMTANTPYTPLLNSDIITDACGNFLDGDKDGIAEGSISGDDYAPLLVGTPEDWSFTTGETIQCVPEITSINPASSYYDDPDSTIVISGENFDDIPDTVFFTGNLPVGGGTMACYNNAFTKTDQICMVDWDGTSIPNTITVKIPAAGLDSNGAITGPIKVKIGQFTCDPSQRTCIEGSNKGLVCADDTQCLTSSCGSGSCSGGSNAGNGCDADNECQGSESNAETLAVLSPHINNLSPASLGAGSGLGIFGAQFGNNAGTAYLVNIAGSRTPLPLPCASASWSDSYIVGEIPLSVAPGNYTIQIMSITGPDGIVGTADDRNSYSNLADITITNDPPGPLLCPMPGFCSPSGASVNFSVDGKRFGTQSGDDFVEFLDQANAWQANATISVWVDIKIDGQTPNALPDNPAYRARIILDKGTAQERYSNSIPYEVPCTGRPDIVLSNACPGSSPNPRPDTVDNCSNLSVVSARFTQDMTDADLIDSNNVSVHQCNVGTIFGGSGSCGALGIGGALSVWPISLKSDEVRFAPDAALVQNTWYEFRISGNVRSAGGLSMGANKTYPFHIRDSAEACAVDAIDAVPNNWTMSVLQTRLYKANTLNTATCNTLNPPARGWTWSSAVSTIATVTNVTGNNTDTATGAGLGMANIPAVLDVAGTLYSDSAQLTITAGGGGGGAAVCGNGVAEGGETCDDGDTINGDGCSSVCALEAATACNNNDMKDLVGEFCDDTNSDGIDLNGKTCVNFGFSGGILACVACGFDTAGCTGVGGAAVCGNGKIDAGEQCDDKNIFANDGCSEICKMETPTIFSVKPANGAANVCKNAAVEITFTGLMDFSTITPTNIRLLQGVVPVAGSIQARYIDSDNNGAMDQTLVTIYPTSIFSDMTNYSVEVLGGLGGVKSKYGAVLAASSCGAAMVFNVISNGADRCIASFTTGTEICKIDKVAITLRKDFNPDPDPVAYDPRNYSGPDLFTCAGKNDCPDDFDVGTEKNQHNAIAQSFDANGQELSGITYSWTKSTDAPFTMLAPADKETLVQADPKSGIGALTVKADGGAAGIMSVSTNVTVAPCDNPWPPAPNLINTTYPFQDNGANPTNFSLWYCRDAGAAGTADDLPALNIISKNGSGEMIKELFFYDSANPNDALGLRVYQNYDSTISNKQYPWSAREWYEKRAPNKQGAPASTTVDGWEGVQAGRSIYVNAANHIDANKPKTHIYLMSHSDKISANLQNIYGQLKSNWKFAITEYDDGTDGTSLNPPADRGHLRKLQRDTKRLSDLYGAAVNLYQSKISKGKYPPLPSGSYIGGNSTSVWPSWDGALSQEVGAPMPHDPISQMSSLIGWWKLDDGSGAVATNEGPMGADGDLNGGLDTTGWRSGTACKFGSCLEFNGTSDYIDLGSFNGAYSNKLTVAAWIKVKENTDYDDIVAGGCGNFLFTVNSGGKVHFGSQCAPSLGEPNGYVKSNKLVDDDKWHFVAATYDGLVMKLYIDGIFESSFGVTGSFVTVPNANNTGKLFISNTDITTPALASESQFFKGSIDEVRIWNTPLGDAEINNLFKSNAAKFGSSEDSGWDQTENAFSCSAGADFDTHIYHYQNEPSEKNFSLYAALEWVGEGGSTWRQRHAAFSAPNDVPYNPCAGVGLSDCSCYNYRQQEVDAANLGLCGNGQWDSSLGERCDGSVVGGLNGLESKICPTGKCSGGSDDGKACKDNLECSSKNCVPNDPTCDVNICEPYCAGGPAVKAVCGNGKIESPVENCECSDFNNNATCGVAKGLMSEYYCFNQIGDDDLGDNAITNEEIDDKFLDTVSCSPVDCNLTCMDGNPVRAEVNNAIYEPWVEQCEPKRGYCSNSSISCADDTGCGVGNHCIALGNGGYYCDNGGAIQCNNGTRGCPSENTLTSCIGGNTEWLDCGGDNAPLKPYNYLDNNDQDSAITDLWGWCFR